MPEPSPAIEAMPDIVKTVRAEKKGKKLLKMAIGRTDEGIIVDLQSDVEWVASLREKRFREPQFTVGGIPCFASKGITLEETECYFNQPDAMLVNGRPNLTVIMAKGLQSGVRFVFP